jgi:hypothetical protein
LFNEDLLEDLLDDENLLEDLISEDLPDENVLGDDLTPAKACGADNNPARPKSVNKRARLAFMIRSFSTASMASQHRSVVNWSGVLRQN